MDLADQHKGADMPYTQRQARPVVQAQVLFHVPLRAAAAPSKFGYTVTTSMKYQKIQAQHLKVYKLSPDMSSVNLKPNYWTRTILLGDFHTLLSVGMKESQFRYLAVELYAHSSLRNITN